MVKRISKYLSDKDNIPCSLINCTVAWEFHYIVKPPFSNMTGFKNVYETYCCLSCFGLYQALQCIMQNNINCRITLNQHLNHNRVLISTLISWCHLFSILLLKVLDKDAEQKLPLCNYWKMEEKIKKICRDIICSS